MTFNIDVNGILHVTAKDKATGKENKTTVEKSGGLSKEEVEKMKRDAEIHAADDKKRREVIDLKNQGEILAYQTEKMLKDNGDKIAPATRAEIESAVSQLRDNLKGEDGGRSSVAMDNLQTVSPQSVTEEMYKKRRRPRPAARRRSARPRGPVRPRHRRRRRTTT